MRALTTTLREYREALAAFSAPARMFLVATFLEWLGHGVHQVLFNLYLRQSGHLESFIGHAIALNGLGLALAAMPGGLLADRWGRRRCLILGATLDGLGLIARAAFTAPTAILGAALVAGVGQALLAVAAAPFLSEHSTARERTHLFSTFFALELLAGVAGNLIGGGIPTLAARMPWTAGLDADLVARGTLILGGVIALGSTALLLRLSKDPEIAHAHAGSVAPAGAGRMLWPIGTNAFLIGAGAGLVIPFMNLYFATRFHCSSGQIGVFFSLAQISTAIAMMIGPALAARFGKLRTAVASQLLSLPFLVSLGGESHLGFAVFAFWLRATFMQAATPLENAFIMEALPTTLRARATSLMNLVWNIGWAVSATLSGWVIQRFGYATPFYATATLYAGAAIYFYLSFRGLREEGLAMKLSDEQKGLRGAGPFTE
jgi:MFS family permease